MLYIKRTCLPNINYTISLGFIGLTSAKLISCIPQRQKLLQLHVKLNKLYIILYFLKRSILGHFFRGIFFSFVDPKKNILKLVRVPTKHPVYSYKS